MAHIHEKIDFTASVYIVREDKVLLHMHKKLGIWLPPGGHIELDEDPNQAVIREAKEETGFDIELVGTIVEKTFEPDQERDLLPPRFMNRHWFDATRTHEHIDSVYFGRVVSGTLEAEVEGTRIGWFTRDQIEKQEIPLHPRITYYCLAALDALAQ